MILFGTFLNFLYLLVLIGTYYAPPSRPEGPKRYPDRGNEGGALVFLAMFYAGHSVPTVNYATIVTAVTTLTTSTKITRSTILG